MSVDLAPSYLVPDLVLVPDHRRREDINPLPPRWAALAVEVVSPSSTTMDRLTKPAIYAGHGIPAYLRVETTPEVTVTSYVLDPGTTAYRELGTWGPGEIARLELPVPAEFPVDSIVP